MIEFNISPTLLKEADKYFKGQACGKQLQAVYLDKTHETIQTDAMLAGAYFEFKATGALPRSGVEPEPLRTKAGALTAEFKRAEILAEVYKLQSEKMNIKVLETGITITKGRAKGIIDVIAEVDGIKVVLDLKFSGLFNNKWEDYGWHIDSLPYKYGLVIQPIHYEYLTGIPFYWWIFDKKSEFNSKLIRANVDPERIKIHEQHIETVHKLITLEYQMGFKVRPELERCEACPLKKECEQRALTPPIYTIDIGTET